MDERVRDAQVWLNATYGHVAGYKKCREDGRPRWETVHSLRMGLQHEMGITKLGTGFGKLSRKSWDEKRHEISGNPNVKQLFTHAYWVKGYAPYNSPAKKLYADITGRAPLFGSIDIDSKFVAALLTMDAFKRLRGGRDSVRRAQQWINGTYRGRKTVDFVPCDGLPSRNLNKILLKAVQLELGVPEHRATGNFGPATKAGLKSNPLGPGSSGNLVFLFSTALAVSGYEALTSEFNQKLQGQIRSFQSFAALPETGVVDYATWAEVLVSHGDPDRPATAIDCISPITQQRAEWLYRKGFRMVGRYLKNTPNTNGNGLDKELKDFEFGAIKDAGLKLFVIFQYYGGSASYFTSDKGTRDARHALERAHELNVPREATIFFAVDYDATQYDIDNYVIPYFRSISAAVRADGHYHVGVYGARNVCTCVSDAIGAKYSFVSGMSRGFSGNLGFPLPKNWAINQIKEIIDGPHSSCADPGVPEEKKDASCFGLDRNVWRANTDPGFVPGEWAIGGYGSFIRDLEKVHDLARIVVDERAAVKTGVMSQILLSWFMRWQMPGYASDAAGRDAAGEVTSANPLDHLNGPIHASYTTNLQYLVRERQPSVPLSMGYRDPKTKQTVHGYDLGLTISGLLAVTAHKDSSHRGLESMTYDPSFERNWLMWDEADTAGWLSSVAAMFVQWARRGSGRPSVPEYAQHELKSGAAGASLMASAAGWVCVRNLIVDERSITSSIHGFNSDWDNNPAKQFYAGRFDSNASKVISSVSDGLQKMLKNPSRRTKDAIAIRLNATSDQLPWRTVSELAVGKNTSEFGTQVAVFLEK